MCYKLIGLVKTNQNETEVGKMIIEAFYGVLIVTGVTAFSYLIKKKCKKYIPGKGAKVS